MKPVDCIRVHERRSYVCNHRTDGHENDDFDTTTASMLELSDFDSKGYCVKKSYVLRSRFMICLTHYWFGERRGTPGTILIKSLNTALTL